MSDKIELLRDLLPPMVSKTTGLYGILSKGMHQLDEQECKDMFPLLRLAVLSIVRERKSQKDKAKEDIELQKQLHELHNKHR